MVYLAVDSGTTNTMVLLVEDDRVTRDVRKPVGVRNTSIAGNRSLLQNTLRDLIESVAKEAPSPPRFVLAAGMITSSLGLLEVRHVVAPAGVEKLSQNVRMRVFPGVSRLPFFLVPGVRINRPFCRLSNAERTDMIRGEETEIVGLLSMRKHNRPWLLIHLGSHAKAIQINGRGQIVSSTTTLSGECLQALQTQTILASKLASLKSRELDEQFFFHGVRCAKRNGLLRACFTVRLLEENPRHHPTDLYSFLVGALLFSDLQAFESRGFLNSRKTPILLSGQPHLLPAWRLLLRKKRHDVEIVTRHERIAAFLAGLRTIVFASPVFRRWQSS